MSDNASLAAMIAQAQQDLEHSTEWEVEVTRYRLNTHELDRPEGSGWVPISIGSDEHGDSILWRRPMTRASDG